MAGALSAFERRWKRETVFSRLQGCHLLLFFCIVDGAAIYFVVLQFVGLSVILFLHGWLCEKKP